MVRVGRIASVACIVLAILSAGLFVFALLTEARVGAIITFGLTTLTFALNAFTFRMTAETERIRRG